MCIVKGVLLGVVIFIVAGISHMLIRLGITKYEVIPLFSEGPTFF